MSTNRVTKQKSKTRPPKSKQCEALLYSILSNPEVIEKAPYSYCKEKGIASYQLSASDSSRYA